MEESPPPVPTKDLIATDSDSRPPTAASGSKRKRDKQDYHFRNGHLDDADLEGQTPKRSRSHRHGSDNEGFTSNDETPLQNRSIRRKKGARNLSALNLRHAASAPSALHLRVSPPRESRFQEGSLTDKPSDKPPSMFTRLPHADSGTLSYREELMEDYQDGISTNGDSMEAQLQYEKDTRDERVTDIIARQKREENGGIFRFGKSLASNFHPVTLWNRLWNEQKDELTRQSLLEAERKAKLKTEAEAKYAQMKQSDSFGLHAVHLQKPRDSGIAFGDNPSWQEQGFSTPMPHGRNATDRQRLGSELHESTSKPLLRSVRSRFHLRKPSLQNLQQSIKRVASYANIGDHQDREPSTSLSPTKSDLPEHSLLKSASKYDLRRQHKLSKRVSDLEAKLNKARNDLDEALVQASPEVRFGSRFQRFTPSNTLRKPKFVPGALATLPSEGVLFPPQPSSDGNIGALHQARPRIIVDPATAFGDIEEDEETVKAPREKLYPTRAEDIFQQSDQSSQHMRSENHERSGGLQGDAQDVHMSEEATRLPDPNSDETGKPLDSNPSGAQHITIDESAARQMSSKSNAKPEKKVNKPKKRPSRGGDDRAFKPGGDEDDDAEWEEAAAHQNKKTKKRKSDVDLFDSPNDKSPGGKKPRGGQTKVAKKSVQNINSADIHVAANEDGSEDELTRMISRRTSIASEDVTLEPVYEEEEETTSIPLKDAPSKPTAKATPARFGYHAVRSRSSSPQKHIEGGTNGCRNAAATDKADAALTPKTTNGTVRRTRRSDGSTKENFEWPDDVF